MTIELTQHVVPPAQPLAANLVFVYVLPRLLLAVWHILWSRDADNDPPPLRSPYISLFWLSYESLKERFIPGYEPYANTSSSPSSPKPSPPPEPDLGPWSIPITLRYTLCSVAAVTMSACVTSPIDLIQARWQTSAGRAKDGVKGIVRDLWRQGGVRAFGRGLPIRILYAIPSNGISMTTYESLKRWKGI